MLAMHSRRQSGSNSALKAQRHQVLHRRLAEVVVDAEGLLLAEHRADDAVDLARAGEVVAERLLEHEAHVRTVQAGRADLRAHGGEEVGAGREVHHDDVGGAGLQPGRERGVVGRVRKIDSLVVEEGREAGELVVGRPLGAFDLVKSIPQPGAVRVVGELLARHREDAAAFRQLAVAEGLEQGREELAPGEVAGAAEENEIEGHERTGYDASP